MNWDSCKIKKPPLDTPATRTRQIKEKARTLGFLDCGIVRAGELTEDARRLRTWLDMDFHGEMQYLQNHFEKRIDPRRLVEGACSVIVVLQNYFSPDTPHDPEAPLVSRYAFGKDYHRLVRKKLKTLLSFMDNQMGSSGGRYFVDSAPVLERAWGREAGLGWIGKNSLLLNRRNGSYFFIGVIISALELEYDTPTKDYCGDCTRCIDACPTQAILPGKVVDSKRCISYLTIEYKKDTLPEEFRGKMKNHVFGCDICQEVCPWNKNARPHDESWLKPRPGLLEMGKLDWQELSEEKYMQLFEGSAVKRAKFRGLKRNLDFLFNPA